MRRLSEEDIESRFTFPIFFQVTAEPPFCSSNWSPSIDLSLIVFLYVKLWKSIMRKQSTSKSIQRYKFLSFLDIFEADIQIGKIDSLLSLIRINEYRKHIISCNSISPIYWAYRLASRSLTTVPWHHDVMSSSSYW